MCSLLAIERDVYARRHSRQPFDERYLMLTAEPMHVNDNEKHEMTDLAREVKLRASLIQVM